MRDPNRILKGDSKAKKRTWYADTLFEGHFSPKYRKKHRKTTKLCSCEACGNQRKYRKGKYKLTLQERKRLDKEKA